MRKTNLISAAAIFLCATAAQAEEGTAPPPGFDEALAAELGADEYGMRKYVFVLLKTGPAKITDPDEQRELFAGHFANMTRLAEENALVLAGPFSGDPEKRGIFVLNTESIDDAKQMVAGDLAVAAGVFVAEYSEFYCTAALMQINDVHARIQRKEF